MIKPKIKLLEVELDMQMESRRVLSNWMNVAVRIFLGGVPAGVFIQLVFNLKKYPLWVFYDPAYPYLYNGVVIIQGGVPGHTDHPGTSLQWISGIVSKLTHVLRDNGSSLSEDVVAHSELIFELAVSFWQFFSA